MISRVEGITTTVQTFLDKNAKPDIRLKKSKKLVDLESFASILKTEMSKTKEQRTN